MSLPGTGSEDWVELDLEHFELSSQARLKDAISGASRQIERLVDGMPYTIEATPGGPTYIVADGRRRYSAVLNTDARLVLTTLSHDDGPL